MNPRQGDDELAMELAAGWCDDAQREVLTARLSSDGQFAQRVAKARGMLRLMDCCPAPEPSPQLIARTLSAVSAAARTRMLLDREAVRTGAVYRPTFTLKEMGAMAALLMIVAGLLLPSAQHARQLAQDQACQAQVGQIGVAMARYANENDGQLPAMHVEQAGWLQDGADRPVVSNSRNLWTLIRGEYAPLYLFQCPGQGGSPAGEVAQMASLSDFPSSQFIDYSYQHAINSKPLRVSGDGLPEGGTAMVILADRTPVFVDGRFDPQRLTSAYSPNHGQRGQAVLHLDGRTAWANSALVGVDQDNIWLVQGVSQYQGTERPMQVTDSFLLPSFVEQR